MQTKENETYKKILILSDIHGNLNALKAALTSIKQEYISGAIILGDIIDYGPRSNEVIRLLESMTSFPILVNIWGNHENAIMLKNYNGLSTSRGIKCAQYTESSLDSYSIRYLKNVPGKSGFYEFTLNQYKCLAVHGSLDNFFWKSIQPDNVQGEYDKYAYVFSGHSHLPHYFEKYYTIECPEYRNRKKTVFINPGSIGQPRDFNPRSSYAILDVATGEVNFRRVEYNILDEQRHFSTQVDSFYKTRLERGI